MAASAVVVFTTRTSRGWPIRFAGFYNPGRTAPACRVYAGEKSTTSWWRLASAGRLAEAGPARGESPTWGLISAASAERVDGFVQRALATGHVTAAAGGGPGQGAGFFYRPTVLAGPCRTTRSSARGVRPVVSVTRFSDADQASPGPTTRLRAGPTVTRDVKKAMKWPPGSSTVAG